MRKLLIGLAILFVLAGGAYAAFAWRSATILANYKDNNIDLGAVATADAVALCPTPGHKRLVCLANALKAGISPELEVRATARIAGNVPLTLVYDGVLHRIANHRAIVRGRAGRLLGVIRYSLAAKAATPLPLPLTRRP